MCINTPRYLIVYFKYIYGYPWHLEDAWSTLSRPISWLDEGFISLRAGGLWVDDTYMGTALTSAWARISGHTSYDSSVLF